MTDFADRRPPRDRVLGAARGVVVASAVLAPVVHAVLMSHDRWVPSVTALALGLALVGRRIAPVATVASVIALVPVWQVLMGRISGGDTAVHLVMPWLGAACLAVVDVKDVGWRAPGAWKTGLSAWGLAIAVTWPVVALRELDFTTYTLSATTINGAWGSSPSESAAFVALAAEAQLVAILLCDWYWGASEAARDRAWRALTPGFLAACLATAWQNFGDVTFLSREPWISYGRAAGTLYDANAMGSLAALVGPALAARFALRGSGSGIGGGMVVLGLSLLSVVASGSRAALAAWVVASAAVVWSLLRVHRQRWLVIVAAIVVGLGGAVSVAAMRQGSGNAVPRVAETLRTVFAAGPAGLASVLWDRYGYGPTSMAMIREHPWVGVGVGVFGVVVADYSAVTIGHALPPDNAQNWWRHEWAELGALGAAGAFLCSWLVLVAVVRLWRRDGPAAGAAHSAPLLALGVMAVVSPPTQHPLIQAVVALTLADAARHAWAAGARADANAARGFGWTGPLVWLVALVAAVATAREGAAVFRPPLRAARFGFQYSYGVSSVVLTSDGGHGMAARLALAVVPPTGRVMVVNVSLPHDDLGQRPAHVEIGDGTRAVCTHEVYDRTPVECRIPTHGTDWRLVQLRVNRARRTVDGVEEAAAVTWRFEP